MNRHTAARFLRLAIMSCVLLLALQTPALAIAIFNTFVQASVSAPEPIPSGTSISFVPGDLSSFQQQSGNALGTVAASTALGDASVLVTGFASGPGSSNANISANATSQANLVNLNATTVTFPLTFSHSSFLSTSMIPFGSQSEFVTSSTSFSLVLDNATLVSNFASPCSGLSNCDSFNSGSDAFLFSLAPGSHSLLLSINAFGFASSVPSPSPVPEPASLLLLGTTAAGLELARWRQRRWKQQP
jgi:hypothetical protein